MNLLVDVGLPTETSFYKEIVVKNCTKCDSFKVHAGKDVSVCYSSSTQLNATGAVTYNWKASAFLNDTTIADPVANPSSTTQFVVTGYDSSGVCFDKDTVKVSVIPLPVFNVSNDTSICNGTIVRLLAKGTAVYHYHWTPPDYLSNTSIANPSSAPTDSIRYFVTATDSNNCRSTDSVQINVVAKPVVNTINDTSICSGASVLLSTNATNANKFIWNPATGLNNSSIQNPQASPVASATYTVTASNTICSAKDSVLIRVLSLPDVFAGNDTTVCNEGVAQLHASGAVSYRWHPGEGLSDPTISNPVVSPGSTITYYVTGTGSNNCINTDSVTVFKQANPVFAISPVDSLICPDQSLTLSASGGDSYSWSPSQTLSNATLPTAIASPLETTKYSVYIFDSTCKTSATLTTTVTLKSKPNISISKSNDIDCVTPQAILTATGGVSYTWSPVSNINNTQISNPIVYPLVDTKYFVIATGSNKCSAQDLILVKSNIANTNGNFYIPNAFTPNGDGINDCFGVKYWGPTESFDMSIYNRWGQLIYHSKNVSNCWDGTINGIKQPPGTYVYQISASSICSHGTIYRKGTVVLIR